MRDSMKSIFRYAIGLILILERTSAEPFNPSVHTNCADGRMNIIVRTDLPFKGVVYTESHRSDCYWLGEGTQELSMAMRLGSSECGITYDQAAEDYHVIVYVRQHGTIILEEDRAFNLSCSNPGSSAASQLLSDDVISPTVRLLDMDGQKTHEVVFGEKYLLQIFLNGVTDADPFLVRTCRVFAGDFSTKLIDEAGCSTDLSISSNIRYTDGRRSAEAVIHSMFRLTNAPYVHLQCGIIRCASFPCSKPNCERRRDEPIEELSNGTRNRLETLASTTVKVIEIGNFTEFIYDPPCAQTLNIVTWSCILAGILLAAVICVHVAFCFLYGGSSDSFSPSESSTIKDPAPILVRAFATTTTNSMCSEISKHSPSYYHRDQFVIQ